MFDLCDIIKAYSRIKPYIMKTNLAPSIYLGDGNRNYFFKLENSQIPRSFKVRGAASKITTLTQEEKNRGIVAISSGNHGAAVSYIGNIFGIKSVDIIVPATTPKSKTDYIEHFGGNVIKHGDNYDEAHLFGEDYIKTHNKTLIDACQSDPLVYAGQGTVGLEMLNQNPDLDTIVVPIGGGGLSTGVAVAAKSIKPSIRIIGVQTEACPAMVRALEDKTYYETYPSDESICDAVIGGIGKLAYEMAQGLYDDIILVSEDNVRLGISHMLKKEKIIVEPSSALCIGAVLQDSDRIGGKNIGLVISGGNLPTELMGV